jgi:hypothetical protein
MFPVPESNGVVESGNLMAVLSWSRLLIRGTRYRGWLRHYATSRKVVGSSHNEALGFSVVLILPAALCPWGSTQALTEMSTRNLPGGKGRPARKADHLTVICEPIVLKIWKPQRLTTLWASNACYRDSVLSTFTFFSCLLIVGYLFCHSLLLYSITLCVLDCGR